MSEQLSPDEEYKDAIYNAVDSLNTAELDKLLAEKLPTPEYSLEEMETLYELLIMPTEEKYEHKHDEVLHCLRSLLVDPRFPTPLEVDENLPDSIAMLERLMIDENSKADILQTWLDYDPRGDKLIEIAQQYVRAPPFVPVDIMRVLMRHPAFDANGNCVALWMKFYGFDTTYIHFAVDQASPTFVRLLFEMPYLLPDRFTRFRRIRLNADGRGTHDFDENFGWETPLNLAHRICYKFLNIAAEADDAQEDEDGSDEPPPNKSKPMENTDIKKETDDEKKETEKEKKTREKHERWQEIRRRNEENRQRDMIEIVRLFVKREDVDIHNIGIRHPCQDVDEEPLIVADEAWKMPLQ